MDICHFSLSITVIFPGCTRQYTVKPFPIEPELVPKIQANGMINLINTQSPGTQSVFLSGLAISWVGDMNEWTNQAIELLTHELEQRKMKVSPDATKKLILAVTEGTLRHEFAGVRCIIVLKVTAGNGYSKKFVGNNINPSPFGEMARYYAGANALTEAVIALLNDKALISYLEE